MSRPPRLSLNAAERGTHNFAARVTTRQVPLARDRCPLEEGRRWQAIRPCVLRDARELSLLREVERGDDDRDEHREAEDPGEPSERTTFSSPDGSRQPNTSSCPPPSTCEVMMASRFAVALAPGVPRRRIRKLTAIVQPDASSTPAAARSSPAQARALSADHRAYRATVPKYLPQPYTR